ncbi:putative transcriptional regulator [Metallosphaera yellowstonensis MK1]|jgi:DNA-binding transcriptional ArsR family regulator|uniref:Putative transcriptional regulator n=1 Tax=Metallosphaera yellowstonensis MK1 TaxID=671065 RepID=H2C3B8_9CREN|nr:winged helix-turn-helix domain-containing protein [Metallosphaera yellowstonensis]EHP70739.1 putative transcriptional regulator [Metallosphaera yellowstonensis MK1]
MMAKIDDVVNGRGWETRKKILEILGNGPTTAYEISKRLGLNYSTVRYHLDLLERSGLVINMRQGSRQLYSISRNLVSMKII